MREFAALLVILLLVAPATASPPLTREHTIALVAAVDSVCPLVVEEAQLRAPIREEQQNPTGVVNLRTLHMLGAAWQSTQAQLARERKRNSTGLALFRRWAGNGLDIGFCWVRERNREAAEIEQDTRAARRN
jgi:hypothetical protein